MQNETILLEAEETEVMVPEVTPAGEVSESDLVSTTFSITNLDLATLATLDTDYERGTSLIPKYMKFESKGEKLRGRFLGIRPIKVKDKINKGKLKKLDAAFFANSQGIFLNSGANLLGNVGMLPVGVDLEIEFVGSEQTASGNDVKVFDVYQLKPKAKKGKKTS